MYPASHVPCGELPCEQATTHLLLVGEHVYPAPHGIDEEQATIPLLGSIVALVPVGIAHE
jgi:hypothetical protein